MLNNFGFWSVGRRTQAIWRCYPTHTWAGPEAGISTQKCTRILDMHIWKCWTASGILFPCFYQTGEHTHAQTHTVNALWLDVKPPENNTTHILRISYQLQINLMNTEAARLLPGPKIKIQTSARATVQEFVQCLKPRSGHLALFAVPQSNAQFRLWLSALDLTESRPTSCPAGQWSDREREKGRVARWNRGLPVYAAAYMHVRLQREITTHAVIHPPITLFGACIAQSKGEKCQCWMRVKSPNSSSLVWK